MRIVHNTRSSVWIILTALLFWTASAVERAHAEFVHQPQWAGIGGILDYEVGLFLGEQGVPSPQTRPGQLSGGISWTDSEGRFWLFGGSPRITQFAGTPAYLSYLWRYEPQTNVWTWIKGSGQSRGNYGTRGVPHPDNNPGAREDSSTWIDQSGVLWMFGGLGYDIAGIHGRLNDLWKYEPATGNWTFLRGSAQREGNAVFGEFDVPDPDNTPPSLTARVPSWTDTNGNFWLWSGGMWMFNPRTEMWTRVQISITAEGGAELPEWLTPSDGWPVAWTDSAGRFWLFGGYLLDPDGRRSIVRNDLWRFDPDSREWMWIAGSDENNQAGIYGTLGVAHPSNYPGARWNAASWVDDTGAFWLYGGAGQGEPGASGFLNDLWKYDPVTGLWTWMHGSPHANQPANHGVMGEESPDTRPPGLRLGTTWRDLAGNLWLYGGYAQRSDGSGNPRLSDLWRYNPNTNQWTWVRGHRMSEEKGIYGTQGVPDPANLPGGRLDAMLWTDGAGAAWMFGGYGFDKNGTHGLLNDVWNLDSATGHWVWRKGWDTINQAGIYGTRGTAAPDNTPGARRDGIAWTSRQGTFWLFGGRGHDRTGVPGLLNDLWSFDPATANWTWEKGSALIEQYGIYGPQGTSGPDFIPGAREGAASWVDNTGAFWLFGGHGRSGHAVESPGFLNDLWRFDPQSGRWTWIDGADVVGRHGVYASPGFPDPDSIPGARAWAATWADSDGNLWLFGGRGHDAVANVGELNDFWKLSTVTGLWTWVKGPNRADQAGDYGMMGVPDAANLPGPRRSAATWMDAAGRLWLAGGFGRDANGESGLLSEVWRYNPEFSTWVWLSGVNTRNAPGRLGFPGVPDPANYPGSRGGAAAWLDTEGHARIFGGEGHDASTYKTLLSDMWRMTAFAPSPTPVPESRTQSHTFAADTEGWIFINHHPPFSQVIGEYNAAGAGSLDAVTTTNELSFATWESPLVSIQASESARRIEGATGPASLYRTSWSLFSDRESPAGMPVVRLRTSSGDWQRSDLLAATSAGDAAFSPASSPRTYKHYFVQPEGQHEFRLDFDILSFDPAEAAPVRTSLERVVIEALDPDDFTGGLTIRIYDFPSQGRGSWNPLPENPVLDRPQVYLDIDGLHIRGAAPGAEETPPVMFGFWGSNTDLLLEANAVYRLRWRVSSDATSADRAALPVFRLRVNDSTFRFSALTNIDSVNAQSRVPVDGAVEEYDLWFATPPEIAGGTMVLSFDYLYLDKSGSEFDDIDDPSLTLTLKGIEITAWPVEFE